MSDSQPNVLIVGGGLAGLNCARHLTAAGMTPLVFEASDGVGGRVRTDSVDGFLLDRGFQVLLTAYPEAKAVLDYNALRLQAFEPGSQIRYDGAFHRVVDPFRRPLQGLESLFGPIGTLGDKIRVATLRSSVLDGPYRDLFLRPRVTTEARLREFGFGNSMLDRFFRPFFGGIFLDDGLRVSSRMFDFVFRMLALGDTSIPEEGMGKIPQQLASLLPARAVRLNSQAQSIEATAVTLTSGERFEAAAVVLACDALTAAGLAGLPDPGSRGVSCLYYAAPEPPVTGRWLVLNGDRRGPINNLCVPSNVAPGYAPPGQSLVSVTVLGEMGQDWEPAVRSQLTEWFGQSAASWRHLRTYRIPHAQPDTADPAEPGLPSRLPSGLYVCGDYRTTPSIQGALLSGRLAAEAVLANARS
ncbi:MAG: NAD(P)/FAD-dependent oxidoreductase [Bryobacteraceae bacterium]